MSRTQTTPDFFAEVRRLQQQVASLTRALNTQSIRDVNTSGLTAAQIDVLVFGAADPFDGVYFSDSANRLLLVRMGGKWRYTNMSLIS